MPRICGDIPPDFKPYGDQCSPDGRYGSVMSRGDDYFLGCRRYVGSLVIVASAFHVFLNVLVAGLVGGFGRLIKGSV